MTRRDIATKIHSHWVNTLISFSDIEIPESQIPQVYRRGKPRCLFPQLCFQKAWEYVMEKHGDARLVHGLYQIGVDHAWVEIPGNIIFDPNFSRFYPKDEYLRRYKAVQKKVYTYIEAAKKALEKMNFGPW